MKPKTKKNLLWAGSLFLAFILFTVLLRIVDVRAAGPAGAEVGFAGFNGFVFDLFGGEHLFWYTLTDWIGVFAILAAAGFAVLGLCQLISRKSFKKVDTDLYILACFYIAVMAAYVFFEFFIVNTRPVLLGESPEASYPSSHTMVVLCVLSTAIVQFRSRIGSRTLRVALITVCAVLMGVALVGRLISGVHWATDIIGGVLLSGSLILFYRSAVSSVE